MTGAAARGRSWHVTFPTVAGDVASLVVSTENGPESTISSSGTLTGTDPTARVSEVVKGGLRTKLAS